MPTASKDHAGRPAGNKPQPSPEPIFRALNAYQLTDALRAAVELDVFTAVDEGAVAPAALAARCKASERGLRILCDSLVVFGLLTKKDGRYGLTPDTAAFLSRRSPMCMADVTGFMGHPDVTGRFRDLAGAVRRGGGAPGRDLEGKLDPVWVDFARSMAPMMRMPAAMMADILGAAEGRPWSVLDVAAGHGVFGIALAERNPKARVLALDWDEVLAVAAENAAAARLDGRWRRLPGSAFQVDFGSGHDLVLLTNFLHHFDRAENVALLKKARACLAPHGRVAVLDFVPAEDRVSPPAPASFALVMLASTPAGDAYTLSEYEGMFREAGLARWDVHPLAPTPQTLLVAHRD
ncbi:MAG: class I SAM-dependent methyltransferase [Elusimicrobia bacterium]|nr:class I SAM-dependent methyltransferase [Elusimicrobiota bacterium]